MLCFRLFVNSLTTNIYKYIILNTNYMVHFCGITNNRKHNIYYIKYIYIYYMYYNLGLYYLHVKTNTFL